MQLEQVPLQTLCLGCKRYFIINQKLPLESMTVEFKNYSFPIKESYLKQTLLKTIVGFMNSKGGTIFMGVNDSTGEVKGVSLGRKEMDQFRLMIKQMLEKVQPTVDLVKSEEVSVDFTPVLEGRQRAFYGKYVIKFIVLQGDPSKFYCISEKVRVSGNRIDEVEVISAFRRHNLGGVEEIKGIKVIHEVYEKARNPYKTARTFHENCNPPPICPMLLEKPKPERTPHIFDTEDEKEEGEASQQSEESQNDTIINKIKDIQKPVVQQNKFRVQAETGNFVYFENVKVDCVKSFINFLKKSTTAKTSQEIVEQNGIIKVKLSSNSQKECLIEQFSKSSMGRLMNSFGVNGKVNILNSLMLTNRLMRRQGPQVVTNNASNGAQTNSYVLLFHGFDSGTQGSIQNYLQKCMTTNICRKMRKSKEGLELIFGVKKDMNVFYTLCSKPPHSRQLNQFWSTGTVKLKMYTREQNINNEKLLSEIKKEKQVKVIHQEKQFPSLLNEEIKLEQQNQSSHHKPLELIASSLQPAEVSKLSNYLINNMFYNINKKILASKERFYIRIVFNQPNDTKKFLEFCLLEQHKNLLSQFTASKTLRIGFPGDSLLLYPYTETLKDDLKKVVLKVLVQGAIKKSVVKELGEDQKVWSLNLVDNSKLLESYQKLEAFLRKQGFFINQEWVRFKVFLDYKNLTQ